MTPQDHIRRVRNFIAFARQSGVQTSEPMLSMEAILEDYERVLRERELEREVVEVAIEAYEEDPDWGDLLNVTVARLLEARKATQGSSTQAVVE